MFSCTPADNEIAGYPTCLCCQLRLASAARRISRDLSRRGFISKGGASLASLGLFSSAGARAAPANFTSPIVFTNFMLFDGKSKSLRGGLWLRVDGNRIKRIASDDLTPPEGVRMIDCGRRVMMPGLIDAHWHSIFAALPISALVSAVRPYFPSNKLRGRADDVARLYDCSGPWRSVLRFEAGNRRWTRSWTSYLSFGRYDHDHRWSGISVLCPICQGVLADR